jgi:hypothetical protein
LYPEKPGNRLDNKLFALYQGATSVAPPQGQNSNPEKLKTDWTTKLFALYQGTTSVVPPQAKTVRALAPAIVKFA